MDIIFLIPVIILLIAIFLLHKIDTFLSETYSDLLDLIIKLRKWIFLFSFIVFISIISISINEFLDIKNSCNFTSLTLESSINYIYRLFLENISKLFNIYSFIIILFLIKIIPSKVVKFISNSLLSILLIVFGLLPSFISCGDYRAPVSSVKANMHTFQTRLEIYAIDWNGYYPKNIKELKEEATKKEYWKEVKNPFQGSNKTFLDLPYFNKKIDCLYSLKEEEVSFEAGVVIYNPIIDKEMKITKYYLYGTYLLNNKSKLIEDKGQIFYLTNQ